MTKAVPFLLLLALLTLSTQIHNIYELSSLTIKDLEKDDLVEVDQTSNNKTSSLNNEPNYYIIKVAHKQKKQAYMGMQTMFKQVFSILIKNRIIPDEDSLVKSRIKPQYLSKKRSWCFSTIFVIFGDEEELERVHRQLFRIRVQKLSTRPSINFLNEKVVALEVFNSAKKKLTKELERFAGFEIKDVVEIEIKGAQVQNSDIIEIQLEEEFNESEMILNEEEILQGTTETDRSSLEMKIVFRVGRHTEADSDDEDQDYQEYEKDSEDDLTDQSQNSL